MTANTDERQNPDPIVDELFAAIGFCSTATTILANQPGQLVEIAQVQIALREWNFNTGFLEAAENFESQMAAHGQ